MIKTLVKNRLLSVFGSMTTKSKKGPRKASPIQLVALILIYAVALGSFVFLSTMAAIMLGSVLIPFNSSWLYFALFFVSAFSIIFIFSIFETKSELFDCKDNDLLLSMPIKPRDITLSRISVVLIYNYIEVLVIMLPAVIYYGIKSGDALGVFGGLFITLLIPILATSLASAVGYFVAYITKKLKKNNFFIVALCVAAMVAYFVGYDFILAKLELFLANVEAAGGVAKSEFSFLYHLGNAALFSPESTLIILISTLAIAFVTYLVISKNYIKIITSSVKSRSKFKSTEISEKSVLSALVSKDLRHFFSSPTYMLNTAIGLIFEVMVGVVAIVKMDTVAMLSAALLGGQGDVPPDVMLVPIAIVAIVLLASFNTMGACSLSLEGKRLWILKTMPVRDKDVLHSKIITQIIITLPPTLVAAILFMIAVSAPVAYWAFFILAPTAAIVFSAVFGTVINVWLPKFEFTNEVEPIKQSFSVFVDMIGQMLVAAAVLVGTIFLVMIINPILVSLLVFLFYCLLTALFYVILRRISVKRYSTFEV